MTRKERVFKALKHESTDIVPWHVKFTIEAKEKIAKHLNDPDIIDNIGNHICALDYKLDWQELKPGIFKDEFGVIWNKTIDKDIGVVENFVLSKPSLSGFKLPDPKKPGRFSQYAATIDKYNDRFVTAGIPLSLFERAWTLRGMENLLCDMISEPGFVNDLLDMITDFNIALIDESAKFKIDGVYIGDDWGQQSGLIMGPDLWRKFIKPRIAREYKRAKDKGLKVLIHSCGDVRELFPELIEVGLDVFNPFQPEAYDIYEIKRKFGDKLSFYGGMSVQKILPFGTPQEVRKETEKLLKEIGRNGGYIFSPAHRITKDVPADNITAMLDVLQNQNPR